MRANQPHSSASGPPSAASYFRPSPRDSPPWHNRYLSGEGKGHSWASRLRRARQDSPEPARGSTHRSPCGCWGAATAASSHRAGSVAMATIPRPIGIVIEQELPLSAPPLSTRRLESCAREARVQTKSQQASTRFPGSPIECRRSPFLANVRGTALLRLQQQSPARLRGNKSRESHWQHNPRHVY